LFFQNHNSTTRNRQGTDVGTQYRSVIFYRSAEQKRKAEAAKRRYQKEFRKPIVTEIRKAEKFFPAEEYH